MIQPESDFTSEPQSAVTARPRTPATTVQAQTRGSRATEDLPHSCRCGVRWAGHNTAHCGGCHLTFSAVGHFDRHRSHGQCLAPADIGLVLVSGRAYACWGLSGQDGDTPS